MSGPRNPNNLWSSDPEPRRHVNPGGNLRVTGAPPRSSGIGTFFKVVIWLALLGAGGYFAWIKLGPVWKRFRANEDVVHAAEITIKHLPKKVGTEEELRTAVAEGVQEGLTTHFAIKAKWYVMIGANNDSIRELRNDGFDNRAKAFFNKTISETRLSVDIPGVKHDDHQFPLGMLFQTVMVAEKPWCVTVGWDEQK